MAMTLIQTVTVGSGGAAAIEFINIPQTGKDLYCVISVRSTGSGNFGDFLQMRFNGDTLNNNYFSRVLRGNGSLGDSWSSVGVFPGDANTQDQTASTFCNNSFYVTNYTSTVNKAISSDSVVENNASAARLQLVAGSWSGTTGITSINLFSTSFVEHSSASLYIIS